MELNNSIYECSYGFCEHLKVVHKELTLERFLSNAGIGEGFGADFFAKIYNSVMAEAEDLEIIFNRFYQAEYHDFKCFIGSKFAIPEKPLNMLMNGMNESENYTLISYDTLDYGMTDVDDLIYGEEYEARFTKLFLLSL